tara:strand:+ start:8751 stop:9548 length:798 start_codon:yes stop_codon:yes gene_type:complete
MNNFFELKNKTIFLTGATGYIGKKVLQSLHNEGCKLILLLKDKRSAIKIKQFLKKKNIYIYFADLNNENELELVLFNIKNKFKKIDGIINMASSTSGLGSAKFKNKFKNFSNAINSNFLAPLKIILMLKNCLQKNKSKNNTASVINLSSIYGTLSPDQNIYKNEKYVNPIDYGCSKSSQTQMSRYLANDKSFSKVRFNNIIIGPVPNQNKNFQKQIFKKKLIDKIPIGRFGRPEDLIGIIFLLLSSKSSYITGSSVFVDGGWSSN